MSKKKPIIRPETVQCIDILVDLFTPEQQETLKIDLNGHVSGLRSQFCARWWSYVPISESPLVFQAKAMKILAANRDWITLIEKLKEDNFFARLIDPANYVKTEKINEKTKSKVREKNDKDTSNGALLKTLATNMGGTMGINRAYDHSKDLKNEAINQLDSMTLQKTCENLIDKETGKEDHTDTPEDEKHPKTNDWIHKKDDLETFTNPKTSPATITAKFTKLDNTQDTQDTQDTQEPNRPKPSEMLLTEFQSQQQTNATLKESAFQSFEFRDNLTRSGKIITKETYILAEAINNIQKIDFMDIREKLYKKFDVLFKFQKLPCQ